MVLVGYLVPSVLGVAALLTMAVIYFRKFPKVAALDLEAMTLHRQQARKAVLVQERLRRKWALARQSARAFFTPILAVLRRLFRGLISYLQRLEQRYQQAAKALPSGAAVTEKITPPAAVAKLLQEADGLLTEEKYVEAEKKYIAAITIDARSIGAYRGLAAVYEGTNDWPHAIATLQFLEQLDPKDETTYRQLGKVYQQAEKYEEAMDAYEQALALAPNNPKNLDHLLEIAILNKLKYKAQSLHDRLRTVNPDNQKLSKYQEQIDQL